MARKILLADDSVTAQNMGRKILADAGYEVITVNNGSAALKKIAEHKPDLIVLDVYMPGYSGLEVCQRLKEAADTCRIPVLLTVGKLEPFKPEEARRVRADGFIVKPFEASELLSALSKLEDKVVPRESSKPGRFARATAAIEESRYDRAMVVEEDDSWKNRISFPPKKKEKPVEADPDDPTIYNPVNKDLRTVIEHKEVGTAPAAPAEAPHSAVAHVTVPAAEEAHVNLGALAPQGLPKDVTPEEIAALAAAAAQIKGKDIEKEIEKEIDKPAAPATETAVAASTPVEAAKAEIVEAAKPAKNEEDEKGPVAPAEAVASAETVTATPATFAEQKAPEPIEEKKSGVDLASSTGELMAAIANLETESVEVHAGAGNGSVSYGSAKPAEPVTMALAAADSAVASRWTAVAVALAPEEAASSLEREMQQAYAAFAAAEVAQTLPTLSIPEPMAALPYVPPAVVTEPAAAETAVMEAVAPVPPAPMPEIAPLAAISEVATEAISAAVKELEAVAAKYEAEQNGASAEPATEKSLRAEALESPAASVAQAPDKPEEKAEPKIEEKAEVPPADKPPAVKEAESVLEAAPASKEEPPAPPIADQLQEPQPQATQAEQIPQEEKPATPSVEAAELSLKNEVRGEEFSSEKVSTEPMPAPRTSTTGGSEDMAKRESETAAAWATWRKIRETGGPKPAAAEAPAKESDEVPAPQDTAAMAVAVGAESSPEEVASSLESDPEIASIVDKMLADMRPKIVEEIARKLGKK